jgi:hypothetical protein
MSSQIAFDAPLPLMPATRATVGTFIAFDRAHYPDREVFELPTDARLLFLGDADDARCTEVLPAGVPVSYRGEDCVDHPGSALSCPLYEIMAGALAGAFIFVEPQHFVVLRTHRVEWCA